MPLSDVRQAINRIDHQLSELFKERFQNSQTVSQIKQTTQEQTNVPERESKILAMRSQEVPPVLRPYYLTFLKQLMTLSRSYQYGQSDHEQALVKDFLVKKNQQSVTLTFEATEELYLLLSVAATLNIKTLSIQTNSDDNTCQLVVTADDQKALQQFVTQVYLETSNCTIE